jgi:hypothetical protein
VVGWGWKTLQGAWQVMAVEEARVKNCHEHIKTSTQNDAYHQHLTFFLGLPLAVEIYERQRQSDGVEVGCGARSG